MAEVVDVATRALGTFLDDNMPSLQSVLPEFPAPNQPLKYPALSIFMQQPRFTPMMPWVLSKGAKITAAGPDQNKYPVRRIVGQWDFSAQLDLWCGSKGERSKLFEELFKAFHLNQEAGIKLQLSGYYNIWVHFIMVGTNNAMSNEQSTRNEWRHKVDVLANCFAVIEKNEYLIEEIENNFETPNEIEDVSTPPGDQII